MKESVTLQEDACQSGLGAALNQEGKPVAYASRAMTTAQRNYAITEKQLLAVLFGCDIFHHYMYGKKVNNHKSLESIMKNH